VIVEYLNWSLVLVVWLMLMDGGGDEVVGEEMKLEPVIGLTEAWRVGRQLQLH
jgi:hypothetical protein